MPSVKSPGARGPLGAWARTARLSAGYKSAEEAVAALAEQGWRMRADYLRGIEAGSSRPGPEAVAALERLYGSTAPSRRQQTEEPAGDQAALIAALTRQSEAIERQAAAQQAQATALVQLATEIRGAALSVTGSVEGFGDVLGLVARAVGVELPRTEDAQLGAPSHQQTRPAR